MAVPLTAATRLGSVSILVVDDDPVARSLLQTVLNAQGFESVELIADPRELPDSMRLAERALVLLDLHMPHVNGQESLQMLSETFPEVPVIVITSEDSIETAVECMRLGAFDFMTKPIEQTRLVVAVRNALERARLRREIDALGTRMIDGHLEHPEVFESIVTRDPRMYDLFRYVEAVAPSDQPVLITGESGTGKELLARAIHESASPERPFVPVNVAGLDDTMFSDAIFGHRPGAFTGAERTREGFASAAGSGTLFLDEIGELSIPSQTKLLRLIQEREYYPLGADRPETFRGRIVAATNASLEERVGGREFRNDLYYRLLTHRIKLPPLRERRGDIPLLIEGFAEEACRSLGCTDRRIPDEVVSSLSGYDFPGNIRELRAAVFDCLTRLGAGASERSVVEEFQAQFGGSVPTGMLDGERIVSCIGRFPTLEEVEELLIEEALRRSRGNQSMAARMIGLSQSTLSRKMQR